MKHIPKHLFLPRSDLHFEDSDIYPNSYSEAWQNHYLHPQFSILDRDVKHIPKHLFLSRSDLHFEDSGIYPNSYSEAWLMFPLPLEKEGDQPIPSFLFWYH